MFVDLYTSPPTSLFYLSLQVMNTIKLLKSNPLSPGNIDFVTFMMGNFKKSLIYYKYTSVETCNFPESKVTFSNVLSDQYYKNLQFIIT